MLHMPDLLEQLANGAAHAPTGYFLNDVERHRHNLVHFLEQGVHLVLGKAVVSLRMRQDEIRPQDKVEEDNIPAETPKQGTSQALG